jgi:hypothetical protein
MVSNMRELGWMEKNMVEEFTDLAKMSLLVSGRKVSSKRNFTEFYLNFMCILFI